MLPSGSSNRSACARGMVLGNLGAVGGLFIAADAFRQRFQLRTRPLVQDAVRDLLTDRSA